VSDWIRDLLRKVQNADPPAYLCVCDQEYCYCTNLVRRPDEGCAACERGEHKVDLPTQP